MTAETPTKTHPGAVDVRGRLCLEDERGAFVPLSQIAPSELLEDELVRKLLGYARPLSAELARFKAYSFADIEAFIGLLAQEYQVTRQRGKKGNLTLYSYDRRLKVEIKSAERIAFGPQLQMAKAKVDQCLLNWGASADPRLQTVVHSAFEVDQEGRVSPARVMLLRRAHITDDPEWTEAMRAIDDAIRVVGTKFYMRFYQREGDAESWHAISLDFADVELTPEAEASFSAHRELKDAWKVFEALNTTLDRVDGIPDGLNVAEAVEWLVDSIAGVSGWLSQSAEDGDHVAAAQVVAMLPTAIDAKMAVNRKRVWKRSGDGYGYHTHVEA